MSKLFIDTNIVLDLMGSRQPWFQDAAALFSLADRGKIRLGVSSLTIVNTVYVLSKLDFTINARDVMAKFKILVEVLDLNDKIIELSLHDDSFPDFEDGLQYYSALEWEADVLISRNLRDFRNAALPVMTAGQYLKK